MIMADFGAVHFGQLCRSSSLKLDREMLELAETIIEGCKDDVRQRCISSSLPKGHMESFCQAGVCLDALSSKGIVRGEGEGSSGNKTPLLPTLSNILEAFDVRLAPFLKELAVQVATAEPVLPTPWHPDEPLERILKLRELQSNYIGTAVLSKKYRGLYETYCKLPAEETSLPLKLFWTLFLVAKLRLLPQFPDLVTSFGLLIAVFNILLAHLDAQHRRVAHDDNEHFPMRTPSGAADVLESLVRRSKADSSMVKELASKLDDLLVQILPGMAQPASEQASQTQPDGLSTGCIHVEGLLSDPEVTQNVNRMLNESYEAAYGVAEIDERPLLWVDTADLVRSTPPTPSANPAPLSSALASCAMSTPMQYRELTANSPAVPPSALGNNGMNPYIRSGAMRTFASNSSSLITPSPMWNGGRHAYTSDIAETPVKDSNAAVTWLGTVVDAQSQAESSQRASCLGEAGEDVKREVHARINRYAAIVFPEVENIDPYGSTDLKTSGVMRQRTPGVALYHQVLETLLRKDMDRYGREVFLQLVNSVSFHKCLAASAFEVVVASFGMASHTFPTVLERLHMKPFDLCKFIGTFVRNVPGLPKMLKRHMFSIEEKCLESLAWARGSTLYPLLQLACERQEDAVMGDMGSSPGSGSKLALTPTKRTRDGSPIGSVRQTENEDDHVSSSGFHLPGDLGEGMRQSGHGQEGATEPAPLPRAFGSRYNHDDKQPGRQVVFDFLSRVLRLAHIRANDLCERLDFQPLDRSTVIAEVYTMLHYCCFEVTSLLYGRHLDQLLLCAIYGVCKVHQLKQVTFKDIIGQYKKQAQCKTDTFRSVPISLSPDLEIQQTGDVILFYNSVFIPATKQFVLALGQREVPILPQPTLGSNVASRYGTPLRGTLSVLPSPKPAGVGGSLLVSPLRPKVQVSPLGGKPLSVCLGASPHQDVSYLNTILSGICQPKDLPSNLGNAFPPHSSANGHVNVMVDGVVDDYKSKRQGLKSVARDVGLGHVQGVGHNLQPQRGVWPGIES
eukprot:jgi/Botrbrau1/5307/Bobra.0391s0021.4